jgi:hypothetical protein
MLMHVYDVGRKNTATKSKNWISKGEAAGIKTVTLEFEGDYSLVT